MESGFGQNLEGFLVKGNLSLAPAELPILQGDGSIEGSGTLYFNKIQEYDVDNGIDIQDILIKKNLIYVPYTQPSIDTTTASFIIDGGISIKNTTNSSSVTSGGALTVAGGASFKKRVNFGGIVDVNNNAIINVPTPIDGLDAVNKDYVDLVAGRVSGNFTRGQVIIADSNGDMIRGYDFFTTDSTTINASIPFVLSNTQQSNSLTSGSLQVQGGAAFMKNVTIGGTLNLQNNSIQNVATPLNNSDAATKYYVDSKTYGNLGGTFGENQVLVGTSGGNTVIGSNALLFDGHLLSLDGQLVIYSTSGSTSSTDSTASLVIYGGAAINQSLFLGGTLDVNGNEITNVGYPQESTDAASKQYVDDRLSGFTSGGSGTVSGNFSTGQVIIADNNGTAIRGFNSITYATNGTSGTLLLNNGTNLTINNTEDASGLGSGGSLTVLGGASFTKQVFIGEGLDVNNQRITNVDLPIRDFDAVNKLYVDNLFSECCNGEGNGGGSTFITLNNNVIVAQDIPGVFYPDYAQAFVSTIYVQYSNGKYALFTLYGYKCMDNSWSLLKTFVGDITNVDFDIRSSFGQGILQYTNKNTTGVSSIQFTTVSQINTIPNTNQINYTLDADVDTFQDISELSSQNSLVDSFKLVLHISSAVDNVCGMFLLSCVQTDGEWRMHTVKFGNVKNIEFRVVSDGSLCRIQYNNTNVAEDYIIRALPIKIYDSFDAITLVANTNIPTEIVNESFYFTPYDYYFQMSIYAENPTLEKSALYELQGACNIRDSMWKLNSRYIGDNLGIKFSVVSDPSGNATLQYTNKNSSDVIIKYTRNIPVTFQPLSVSKGGTGRDYLEPYAILRGDGTNPVIATDDFVYKDHQLILGNQSSIVLTNTSTATSITSGGTLTSNGGAAFAKDVYIGGQLDVALNRITNVHDPILDYDAVNKLYVDKAISNIDYDAMVDDPLFEHDVTLSNNIRVPTDIPEFHLDLTTKAFVSNIYVNVNNSGFALYTIRGYDAGSKWVITTSLTGQPCGINFQIEKLTDKVVVQYTNSNLFGSTNIKYRISSCVEDTNSSQIEHVLSSNVLIPDNVPGLLFLNSETKSVKFIMYVSSDFADKYGMFMCSIVYKNNTWDLNTQSIGNITGITLSVLSSGTTVQLQYTNTNNANDYKIRVKLMSILESEMTYTLAANSMAPAVIDYDNLSFKSSKDHYFVLSIYVYVPSLSKYALYEVQGVLYNGFWSINSRYTGDSTGVKFNIYTVTSTDTIGYLTFTNTNPYDAFIKVVRDIPLTTLKPLSVNKGGTGSTYFTPYAVLRGNGTDQIIGSNDFVYHDNQLVLGNNSSIILMNTGASLNGSSGSFISYGGMSINKNLRVGEGLVVNNIDITPSTGDIASEQTFYAQNNQTSPQDVTGFQFINTSIKSFSGICCVTVTSNIDEYDCLFEMRGIKKRSGWTLYVTDVGDDTGITFSITSSGQIRYTSSNMTQWVSSVFKFRATTTTL
jgi:hypothetical protein